MNPEIFTPQNSKLLRRLIYENSPENLDSILKIGHHTKANVAVINASDRCPLTCPNCMFAAPVADRIYKGKVPHIGNVPAMKMIDLINQSEVKLVVFSGGGESIENLEVMEETLRNSKSLEECTIITSGYFATTRDQTTKVINKIVSAIQQGREKRNQKNVRCIFRLSYDNSHNVPHGNIDNIIQHVLENEYKDVDVHVILRTLLGAEENKDDEIAKRFNAQIKPIKNTTDPTLGLPIIDGFPTRWMCLDRKEIGIIYKPMYFEGLAEKRNDQVSQIGSWREIKRAEEGEESSFNLSIRGPRGEGHNYYETVIKGFSHWQDLGSPEYYITPKDQQKKELCLYFPANERIAINASCPDMAMKISEVSGWQDFLSKQYRDVLQTTVMTSPTDYLIEIAEEIEPTLQQQFDQRNFVFAIPRIILEKPETRLYLTIRLLQQDRFRDARLNQPDIIQKLVNQPIQVLIDAYNERPLYEEIPREKKFLIPVDPIIGHEESIIGGKSLAESEVGEKLKDQINNL